MRASSGSQGHHARKDRQQNENTPILNVSYCLLTVALGVPAISPSSTLAQSSRPFLDLGGWMPRPVRNRSGGKSAIEPNLRYAVIFEVRSPLRGVQRLL